MYKTEYSPVKTNNDNQRIKTNKKRVVYGKRKIKV